MATIYNSDLTKELVEGAKIQTLKDKVPIQLAEKVVPVMEVNPKLLRRSNLLRKGTLTNGSSTTIYTTPTDKDFYITGAYLSVVKDATATSTASSIRCTIDGVTTCDILSVCTLTLTAERAQNSISFPFPIKVDRGTNITITNTTNVANITSQGGIIGYISDIV